MSATTTSAPSTRRRFPLLRRGHWFDVANFLLLGVLALTMLYPFIYLFNISISTAAEANRSGLHLFPHSVTLTSYQAVFSDPLILNAALNSFIRTVVGTVLTVIGCAVAAYPLSRKEMPLRRSLMFFVLFTMIFSGGLVPGYLLIRSLGLLDSMASLILPTLLSAFNIIIIRNFFMAIPDSFAEAARIDGASEWRVLFQVYMPMSAPVLATVALWTAVGHWNAWFDAMIYIVSDDKQVLQVVLQKIVIDSSTQFLELGMSAEHGTGYTPQTLKAATTVVTILPILLCYPFLQRFFKRGILLGGVKE